MSKVKRLAPQFIVELLPRGTYNAKELNVALASWMSVHKHIKAMPNTRAALSTVAKLLYLEYQRKDGPRMDIVARLYGKFNRMRMEVERAEL